jgi:hypothetical protein
MAKVEQYPQVSDGLAAIIRAFTPSMRTGLVMTRPSLAVFLEGLQALHDAAVLLENEADRNRWNRSAQREAAAQKREVLEAGIAEGKVSILPVVARHTAQTGGQEGGAA